MQGHQLQHGAGSGAMAGALDGQQQQQQQQALYLQVCHREGENRSTLHTSKLLRQAAGIMCENAKNIVQQSVCTSLCI